MSHSQELTQWLTRVLSSTPYAHAEQTYNDILCLLQIYPNMKPRTRVYTSDEGKSALLLNVYGSIPSNINGKIYRIPVQIWFPLQYPSSAPLIYVTPTEKMVLQPGNHVDSNGRCYSYLISEWRNDQNNNRRDLRRVIEELSGIFSREPPVFAKVVTPTATITPVSAGYDQRIPLVRTLPKAPVISDINTVIKSPEPTPTQPVVITTQPDFLDSDQSTTNTSSAISQRKEISNYLTKLMNNIHDVEVEPRLNKFAMKIEEISESVDKFPVIFSFEQDQIHQAKAQISANSAILKESIIEAQRIIAQADSTSLPHPDELITSEALLYSQLYALVCEEQAMEDTVYSLSRALDNGAVNPQSYMKMVRQLAREQFMKRALILSISTELELRK